MWSDGEAVDGDDPRCFQRDTNISSILKIGCLGLFVSVGLLFHVLSCVLYNNYWPLLIFVAYIFTPVPLFLLSKKQKHYAYLGASDDDLVSAPALFLSSFISTSIIGIPSVLLHVNMITSDSFGLNFAGIIVLLLALGIYAWQSKDKQQTEFMM